jgi:hypothetical protein
VSVESEKEDIANLLIVIYFTCNVIFIKTILILHTSNFLLDNKVDLI